MMFPRGKAVLSLALTLIMLAPAAQALDVLRSVPLEIGGYTTGTPAYPETFTTAEQVLQTLNTKRNVLFHMETIRRSYAQLPQAQKDALLARLLSRYQASSEDPVLFFDHGYAQLVYNQNKTGLFFLRKGNDRLQDQFSAMAYGMAQAEIDLNQEGGTPTDMNSRKVSVIQMMQDAATRNGETPKAGFWPSYVRVLEAFKDIPGYSDITSQDFSEKMVPYGNTPIAGKSPTAGINGSATSSAEGAGDAGIVKTSCTLTSSAIDPGRQYNNIRKLDLNNDGTEETVRFYQHATDKDYDVVVTNKNNGVLLTLTTPVAPYIIEDLDGDNVYEIVIRQFRHDPYNPVRVYRYDGCEYVPDTDIDALFR